MQSDERLAQALEASGVKGLEALIVEVKQGQYNPYLSKLEKPTVALVRQLTKYPALDDVVDRVLAQEFVPSEGELQAYYASAEFKAAAVDSQPARWRPA